LMVAAVTEHTGEPELWRRYLVLLLDGMRAQPGTATPFPAASTSDDEIQVAITGPAHCRELQCSERGSASYDGLDHVRGRRGDVPGADGSGWSSRPAVRPSTTGSDGRRVFAPNARPSCRSEK
jgi:hypothetical protein